SNAVGVGQAVKAKLEEVRKTLPKDLSLAVVFDGTKPVEEAIHEIEFTLILSVLLTGLVCWLFLASLSSTIHVLLAIPTPIIGRFFFQFGVTVSVAVAFSLLEALTLTPSRCSQFLSVGERTTWIGKGVEAAFERLSSLYRRALRPCLHHRLLVLAGTLALFLASLFIVGFVNREFVPSQDIGRVLARIQTPVGSSVD